MASQRAGGFTVLESSRPAVTSRFSLARFQKNDGTGTALSRPFRRDPEEVQTNGL